MMRRHDGDYTHLSLILIVLAVLLVCLQTGCSAGPRAQYVAASNAYAAAIETATDWAVAGEVGVDDMRSLAPYVQAADAAFDEALALLPAEGEPVDPKARRVLRSLSRVVSAVADRMLAMKQEAAP